MTKHSIRYFTIAIIVFCTSLRASAEKGYFEFTPLAKQAYTKAMSLRLVEANNLIQQMHASEPDNLVRYYIENYVDCLQVFISENRNEYDKLDNHVKERIKQMKKGDETSPYYLFCIAQTRLLYTLNCLKFHSYLPSMNQASAAFEELERNAKKNPDFMPNKMSLGAFHAALGAIPNNWKWSVKMISGMSGTVKQGVGELDEVMAYAQKNEFLFEQEAYVIYALIQLNINNAPGNAWSLMSKSNLKPKENPLACFAMANIATRTGHNDKAIEILSNQPQGNAYLPVPFLDYMLGSAKLYRNDTSAARHLQNFLDNFKGFNNVKSAHQRLAWCTLLKGNTEGYWKEMYLCKTVGKAEEGIDKNALKEANSGVIPDPTLLAARLLFDGGYFTAAEEKLKAKKEADFATPEQKLEYHYRKGRIAQSLKKNKEAIEAYNQTLELDKKSSTYFPCNSALQLGIIYELIKDTTQARVSYNLCLELSPDEFADSFHSKAKAGLGRLKGK